MPCPLVSPCAAPLARPQLDRVEGRAINRLDLSSGGKWRSSPPRSSPRCHCLPVPPRRANLSNSPRPTRCRTASSSLNGPASARRMRRGGTRSSPSRVDGRRAIPASNGSRPLTGTASSRSRVTDRLVPIICLLSPVLCFALNAKSVEWLHGYKFGFELLILNGLLTYSGLWLIRKSQRELKS